MKPRASHIDPCSSDPVRLASLLSGVFVMICLLLLFLWLKFHTEIAETIVLIQDAELTVISLFTHQYDVLRNSLHQAIPERISPVTLWTLCTITGSVLQWPVCVFLLILAFFCTKHALSELYCKQFGLDGMKVALARIHSIGTAWSGNQQTLAEPSPPEKPLRPMDPALKMEEWMNRHAIGSTEKEKKEAVRQALTAQLGQPWNGLEHASLAEQYIFVSLSLFIERRKDEALLLISMLSEGLSVALENGMPETPLKAPAPFVRYLNTLIRETALEDALDIARKHGWTRTALSSLLQQAQLKTGVLNPGLLSTIQLLDRTLWLALTAVSYPREGKPDSALSIAPCPEAAAVITHWQEECRTGHALNTPHMSHLLKVMMNQ